MLEDQMRQQILLIKDSQIKDKYLQTNTPKRD